MIYIKGSIKPNDTKTYFLTYLLWYRAVQMQCAGFEIFLPPPKHHGGEFRKKKSSNMSFQKQITLDNLDNPQNTMTMILTEQLLSEAIWKLLTVCVNSFAELSKVNWNKIPFVPTFCIGVRKTNRYLETWANKTKTTCIAKYLCTWENMFSCYCRKLTL